MKKLVVVASALALFGMVSTGTVMAADKATAYCQKMAKKHHVTADKMDSYMKTCVAKHHKKHKKAAKHAAKPAAKPAAAPATAPASEAPAAGK